MDKDKNKRKRLPTSILCTQQKIYVHRREVHNVFLILKGGGGGLIHIFEKKNLFFIRCLRSPGGRRGPG